MPTTEHSKMWRPPFPLPLTTTIVAILLTGIAHGVLLRPAPPLRGPSWSPPPSRTSTSRNEKSKRSSSGGGFGKQRPSDLRLKTKSKPTDRNFVYAGPLRPHPRSPPRVVDPSLVLSLPDYALDGRPKRSSSSIAIKTPEQIAKMRSAGRVAREVLDVAASLVRPGVATDDIDRAVHEACLERGAYPSPLNYRNFPKSCCTSVNEVICHGIPDSRPLREGDVVNVDVTAYLDGYHGDCSEMFAVGGREALDEEGRRLIQTTYDSWIRAMEAVRPGADYNVVGKEVEGWIVPRGYSTVREFCGHGIGSVFHEAPNVYHYAVDRPLGTMEAGHVFTVEPMICEGLADPYLWEDGWTATTVDGKRSAQFEHTLLVTEDGVEALTGKSEGSPLQFWEEESEVRKGVWLGTSQRARERAEQLNKILLPS